ncbi:MAG: 23S rRNA (uracil(1939)-C(5))-methyltransferase RlmD [Parcubacteria group bacterium]|nr:23S rRNA (uracil(1939)-C(5))-methyltransferase RlmD [Parcubacteria group bacterium]
MIGTSIKPTVRFEKLVFGGQALARHENKVIFAWNALPGEEAVVEIMKRKKDFAAGVAVEILKPSPHRIAAIESHYLSCSPWQIMDYEYELHWKKEIVKEIFLKNAGVILSNIDIEDDPSHISGYRNKEEYNFYYDEAGNLSYGFFYRDSHRKYPIHGCILPSSSIDEAAQGILAHAKASYHPKTPKSVIVRSNRTGDAIAALFLKDRVQIPSFDHQATGLKGFHAYYSSHLSPASVVHDVLYRSGQDFLAETLLSCPIEYGLNSFFQINIPVFEKTLADISGFLRESDDILDFYSGVGSISVPLGAKIRSAILCDVNSEAIDFAKKNIEKNGLQSKFSASAKPAEAMLSHLSREKTLIVDPPRDGLSTKLVKKILEAMPQRIIYLSCNPSTQARDFALVKDAYDIVFHKLYNFFPRTPHVESLLMLQKK